MTRKQRRTAVITGSVTVLAVAVLLVLSAMRDSIVFFHSPTEVAAGKFEAGATFRLGGLVAMESVKRDGTEKVQFDVTDQVETWHERLVEAGVVCDTPPKINETYHLHHAFYRDPDGHVIEVQQFLDPNWPDPHRPSRRTFGRRRPAVRQAL